MEEVTEPTQPADDTATLKKTLDAVRKEADKLKAQLRDRDEKEALANKSLADQVAQLQTEKANLAQQLKDTESNYTKQLQGKEIGFEFTRSLSKARVLPEYEELLHGHASSLELRDGKIVGKDGSPLDQVVTGLRSKYPAMFAANPEAAGDGATPSANGAPAKTIKVVSEKDFMKQLDAIADGSAIVK